MEGTWNDIPDAHWRAFFGRNADHYMRQLERVRRGRWPNFHWEAFLLGFMWILYRRMYLVSVCVVILMAVETTVEQGLLRFFEAGWSFEVMLARAMALAYGLAMGFVANRVYHWHARRCINNVTAKRAVHVE
ncbi:MAG: DUF2628 domain-containing protein [Flavobacteriales bacterium]